MGSKLDSVLHNINNNKNFLLSIFDTEAATNVVKYFPGAKILEQFGTGEAYFEHLFQNGHRNMVISSHSKNGSGKKKLEEPITVSLSPNNDTSMETVSQSVPNPVYPAMPMTASKNENFGLGVPELMSLYVAQSEANRLRGENTELKADNKRLEAENKKYHEQILSDKYDYDKEKDKKESTNNTIQGLMGALPMVMPYLMPNQQSGLNAPTDFGSQVKNDFVQTIKTKDDITITVLSKITQHLGENELFSAELLELLKKHNLWQ
ncbi:hypothetical protein [Flavobacterium sp. GCM10027622]|uniref:hypothetical protein n=1 Tax=unclassified Flavobacterium TaxID=196869 RepID=UPI003608DCC9